MKIVKLIIALLISTLVVAQQKTTSEGEERVRISLIEKQNLYAKDLPYKLLKAFCNGDIKAYYPANLNVELNYPQFLSHFGMEKRAYAMIDEDLPDWYCDKTSKCIALDHYTLNCMQFEIEIGEENFFNRNTSKQEKRIDYVKIIYSYNCNVRGVEIEGPVFRMSDIKKLNSENYKINNSSNQAASLSLWSYLTLGNFKRTIIYKKNQFVESPARVSSKELELRIKNENSNWEN